jgi:hypothetical protein
MADVVTPPFKTIVFPNIPDPNIPNAAQLGLFVIQGSNTVPTGISDNGVVVGQFSANPGIWTVAPYGDMQFVESGGSYAAFFAVGPMFSLEAPPQVYRTGINDSGAIVGSFIGDEFDETSGFVTGPPNFFITLGYSYPQPALVTPIFYPALQPGFGYTNANGVNNSGEIIGTYFDYSQNTGGGFVLNNGAYTPLSYSPLAINNLGQIVGEDSSGNFLIDTNGSIRNLGILPFTPTGFNDNGTIVGGDYLYNNGFLTQVDLKGESNVQINAINDNGYFVGTADGPSGQIGFEVTTPEPFAGIPLLAGVCGLAILRFRTRRHGASEARLRA